MPLPRRNGFLKELLDHPAGLHPPWTYCIYDGTRLKIGRCTDHPKIRLSVLATGNSHPLELLAYTSAGVLTERQAHRRLSSWRRHGEWFEVCEPVLRELQLFQWLNEALYWRLWRMVHDESRADGRT
jgi:hypothetical protein